MEQDATLIKDFGPVGQRGGVGNAVSSAPGQVFASFPDDFCRNVRKCQSMSCFRVFFLGAGPEFLGLSRSAAQARIGQLYGTPSVAFRILPQHCVAQLLLRPHLTRVRR